MSTTKLVMEIRLGLVKAAIFHQMTRAGERYHVTLTRLFKDGAQWRVSSQFGRDDLLQAAKVLDMAHTWIHQQDRNDRTTGENREGDNQRVSEPVP